MINEKILFIDTETGGIDPNVHSLLSIGLVVWHNFTLIGTHEILLKEENLVVTQEALEINQINIERHVEYAFDQTKAIKSLMDFIRQHFDDTERVTIGGHNINFDIGFLKVFFKRNNVEFGKVFSHRYVDTSSILFYLYLAERIKEKAISSDRAFELFNVDIAEDKRHTALGDAIGTTILFNKLIHVLKKIKKKPDPGPFQSLLFDID